MTDNPYDSMLEAMQKGDVFTHDMTRNGKRVRIRVEVIRDDIQDDL